MRNVAMPLPGRSKCCTRSIQFNCFQSIPPRLALAHRSIHKHSTNIQWRPTFPSKPITALTAARRGYAAASNSSVSLRPYQQECLSACLDAIQNGVTRIGASLPTGAGKTTVFSELIHQLPSRQRDESSVATQSIVLVGTVELARQAAQRISSMHPQLTVEIEQGAANKASGLADVTVCTYQTLTASDGQRLQKFDPDSFKLVVVDEAHHVASASYLRIVDYFTKRVNHQAQDTRNVGEQPPGQTAPAVVGFSATFSRHDGLALSSVFDHIVYHKDFLEMIQEGWLCPVKFTTVHADFKLSNVRVNTSTGDFAPTSLSQVIREASVTDLIVHAWETKASERRSTLVFAVDVAHAEVLTAAFVERGVDARMLVGTTAPRHRIHLLEDFRNGVFPVLVNCAILTEGADVPAIDCVLMARPTMSKNLFSQMIGRGLRHSPSTEKKDCLILDVVGSANRDLVCSPTLFGLDPRLPLEEMSAEKLVERAMAEGTGSPQAERSMTGQVSESDLTYREFSVEDLMAHGPKKSDDVASISQLAWVPCGNRVFVLELMNQAYIRVEPDDDSGWTAKLVRRNPVGKSRFMVTQITTLPEPDFGRCIRMCDAVALRPTKSTEEKPGSTPRNLLLRNAPWRSSPATEKQRQHLLNKLGDRLENFLRLANNGKSIALEDIDKGLAGKAMTMLRHGKTVSRLVGHQRSENQRIKKVNKHLQQQARQKPIQVGPLNNA